MENTKGDFLKVFYEYDITEQYENEKVIRHRKAEFESQDRETTERKYNDLKLATNTTAISKTGF